MRKYLVTKETASLVRRIHCIEKIISIGEEAVVIFQLQSGRAWSPFLSTLGLCSQGRHHLPQTSVIKYLRTKFPPQPILKTPQS